MKLDKAIKLIEMDVATHLRLGHNDMATAQQLGVEALKVYLKLRRGGLHNIFDLLPGETKE